MNLFDFNQKATKGTLGKGEPMRPGDPRNPKPILGPFQKQIQTIAQNTNRLNALLKFGPESVTAMEQQQKDQEIERRAQQRRIGNPVGGVTTVGVTYGPGQELQSVGQWNYKGFGDRDEDVGESGSERDDSGQRFNEDRNGNMIDVGNRINARAKDSQPPVGTALNQIKYNSPLAYMGRNMSPAQTMLNTPMDDEDYDPFDMEQTRLNESAWNRRSF